MLAPPGARLELLTEEAVEGLDCPSTRPPAAILASATASGTTAASTMTSTAYIIKPDTNVRLYREELEIRVE